MDQSASVAIKIFADKRNLSIESFLQIVHEVHFELLSCLYIRKILFKHFYGKMKVGRID